jgi:hypothetical protein
VIVLYGLSYVLIFLVVAEVIFLVLVNILKRNFQWLITAADEKPAIDQWVIEKYFCSGFHYKLGWVRQPNSSVKDVVEGKEVMFQINELGARTQERSSLPQVVAVFGDSYAFCRQVSDEHTWEEKISEEQDIGVLNLGVGNYGIDQALLRYESMDLPNTVEAVVLCFVPETICRIQSIWKHYLEFGNTLAFKPRFKLDKSELVLIDNPIQSTNDLLAYEKKLASIQAEDRFYVERFKVLQFRFPYLISLCRNPMHNFYLLSALIQRSLLQALGFSNLRIAGKPFSIVMQRNIREAQNLYQDSKSTSLLEALLKRFCSGAESRRQLPIILVVPQLNDLMLAKSGMAKHLTYFKSLSRVLPIVDVTNHFLKLNTKLLYINDVYGGHLSKYGNEIVAKVVTKWLRTNDIV